MSGTLDSGLQLRKRGLVGNGGVELPICTLTEVPPELGDSHYTAENSSHGGLEYKAQGEARG